MHLLHFYIKQHRTQLRNSDFLLKGLDLAQWHWLKNFQQSTVLPATLRVKNEHANTRVFIDYMFSYVKQITVLQMNIYISCISIIKRTFISQLSNQ